MQSEFARRLEKAEQESKWKLDQKVEGLSDASKAHLRQVSSRTPPPPTALSVVVIMLSESSTLCKRTCHGTKRRL